MKRNHVIVGENKDVFAKGLVAKDLNFITRDDFTEKFVTTAKIVMVLKNVNVLWNH